MKGVFAVSRLIFDHEFLDDGEPYSRREAWLWIISQARYKAGEGLARGEFNVSMTQMASKFRWSSKAVRCFLSRLQNQKMITKKTSGDGRKSTVWAVENYENFQFRTTVENRQKQPKNGLRGTLRGTLNSKNGAPSSATKSNSLDHERGTLKSERGAPSGAHKALLHDILICNKDIRNKDTLTGAREADFSEVEISLSEEAHPNDPTALRVSSSKWVFLRPSMQEPEEVLAYFANQLPSFVPELDAVSFQQILGFAIQALDDHLEQHKNLRALRGAYSSHAAKLRGWPIERGIQKFRAMSGHTGAKNNVRKKSNSELNRELLAKIMAEEAAEPSSNSAFEALQREMAGND
jgi:hypothetical protein